jgi:sporulation protein YlmC with PRC-barrel domain
LPERNGTARSLRTTKLVGTEVQNLQGEKLGKIDDFVLNMDTGTINYAALATGGVLGIGEKLLAVPFNELQTKMDGSTLVFVLNIPKETLKNQKGFDKDNWPETAPPFTGQAAPRTATPNPAAPR